MPEGIVQSEQRWAVVSTHPNREKFAADNLYRQGFRTYCPLIRKRAGRGRRDKFVIRPLFPNYIFTSICEKQHSWRPILSTYGVRSLVRAGKDIAFLQPGIIDGLRSREIDGVVGPSEALLSIGDRVQIAGGAFDGWLATVVCLEDRDRVVVLMQLLSQTIRVKLHTSQLMPAPS